MNNKALNKEFAQKYTKKTGFSSSEDEDDSTGKCKFRVLNEFQTLIFNNFSIEIA